MASIEYFDVIEPPTSEAVVKAALDAFRTNTAMQLVIRSVRTIPRPENITVGFTIRDIKRSDNSRIISGPDTIDQNALVVRAGDNNQPATASWVTDNPKTIDDSHA